MTKKVESVIEKQRETKVTLGCDVLVAGGGIAGISAALAAARSGAEVLLAEREYALGGLATLGLVAIYLPLCDGMGRQVTFGIGEELLRLSIKHGAEGRYPGAWLENGTAEARRQKRFEVQFNPHLFAIEAEMLLLREGVKILYGTLVCDVVKEGWKISHAIVESKSGRSAIRAKSVVDATGDADICKMAGEATCVFAQKNALANWYYYAESGSVKLEMLGVADTVGDGEDKSAQKPLIGRRFTGLDSIETSEMVCLGHEQMIKNVLRRREADRSHTPVAMPSIPQLRMTRRLSGACTLDGKETGKETRGHFDNSIGAIGNWREPGPVYELPFAALHGSRVKNLIVAGRCISADGYMWDMCRVIPGCAVTGEAAGTAAAMSDDYAGLDISDLQKELERKGHQIV